MIARITNLWSKVYKYNERQVSRVVIESTYPFSYQVKKLNQRIITLTIFKAHLNMYCDTISVYDGLIEQISIQELQGSVNVKILLNHDASYEIFFVEGVPVRTFISFNRDHLFNIFHQQKLVIDPGHGGKDSGGRGPVDLLEKNVVLHMALGLKALLEGVGAQTFLTREDDRQVSIWQRLELAKKEKAHLFISFHTHYSPNSELSGLAVKYNQEAPASLYLARVTAEELTKKIKSNVRGITMDKQLSSLGNIPAITVEPVCISNWVEEGLLRNPSLYDKIAVGVFNGLRRFFTEQKPDNILFLTKQYKVMKTLVPSHDEQ